MICCVNCRSQHTSGKQFKSESRNSCFFLKHDKRNKTSNKFEKSKERKVKIGMFRETSVNRNTKKTNVSVISTFCGGKNTNKYTCDKKENENFTVLFYLFQFTKVIKKILPYIWIILTVNIVLKSYFRWYRLSWIKEKHTYDEQ